MSSDISDGGAGETAHQVSSPTPETEQVDRAEAEQSSQTETEQVGQTGDDPVNSSLSASASKDSVVVVNPSPFERTALVLADLPEDRALLVTSSGAAVPVQRLEHSPTLLDETVLDDLSQLLGRTYERELFGHEITSWTVEDGLFTIVVSRHASGGFAYEDLRRAILGAGPGPWRVRTLAEPVVTVAAQVTVPPHGRSVLTARAGRGQVPLTRTPEALAALTAPEGTLDNGLLRVGVADDGTLSLRGLDGVEVHGVGRITHGGDAYDRVPPPDDRLVDSPSIVKVEEIFSGPLVSVLEVSRMYEWPAEAAPGVWAGARDTILSPASPRPETRPGSRSASVETLVTTRVELRAGEPFVRCELNFDVRCRDHRIRWHAGLPREAAESFAEGRFAVMRRGPAAEGGYGEEPVPTLPAESYVAAGGLAVLLDHVTEYELLRTPEPELALTLVRSVEDLSRDRSAYRDEPAGPQRATPATQCQGPFSTRFAVLPYAGSRHEAGLPRLAEEYRHDLLAVPGSGSTIGTPV